MPLWENLRLDLTTGWRSLRRSPGFVVIVLITLSFGIGAATVMFSVVRGVWLRPLPYDEPDRLVGMWSDQRKIGVPESPSSYANLDDWRKSGRTLSGAVIFDGMSSIIAGPSGVAEKVEAALMGPEFWSVLGVNPALGRGFTADEVEHQAAVVVIAHTTWQNRFGGDPGILGRRLVIDGKSAEIIGVMPKGFFFPEKETELWFPLSWKSDWEQARTFRGTDSWHAVGRLAPGVSLDEAQAEFSRIAANLEKEYPEANAGIGARLVSLPLQVTGRPVRQALVFLSGAVLAVLIIACSNVAGMLLVRGTVRQREFAVREALGASRARVMRQLVAESSILAVLAAGCGAGLAELALQAIRAFGPGRIPRLDEVVLDPSALVFATLLSLGCVVLFSLLPAAATTRGGPMKMLRNSGRSQSAGGLTRRLRTGFVVAQIALAVALLTSTAVFTRSFVRLADVDSGYHAPNVLLVGFMLSRDRPATDATPYVQSVLERMRQLPGVHSAGFSEEVMLGEVRARNLTVEGASVEGLETLRLPYRSDSISPDFFRAAGVSLRAGRFFDEHDTSSSPAVVIVNETLARRLWPDGNAVGRRLNPGSAEDRAHMVTVVGVVADLRRQGPERSPVSQAFWPLTQRPSAGGVLVIATGTDASMLAGPARAAAREVDPTVPIAGTTTLRRELDERLSGREFNLGLLVFFAIFSLTLAGGGVFALLSYNVTLRFQEFGIRLALGARPRSLMRLVISEGIRLTLVGIVVGEIAAAVALRGLGGMLYETSAMDPLSFGGGFAVLVAVAFVACYLPARRVMKLDPLTVLHAE